MLRLYNTKNKAIETFQPLRSGEVGMYSCGPTVYDRAHIGNLRSYVIWDVLRRKLKSDGFSVKHVMNITDVGHLTDDADEGEDKMMKAARDRGLTAWDIAKEFEGLFKEDAETLNIVLPEPSLLCRATDHIEEQIDLIKRLEEKGFTYQITDGVYFDTGAFPRYGSFSGQSLEEKEEGARVARNAEKRAPSDFALWKFSRPSEGQRQMEWESPWGVGFPGWHLECSAMSAKYLGQPFDIHTGGVDHIPVHHENEIAQSAAAYGVPLADFWLHSEFLTVDGRKMSKSLGNTYTLEDCADHGIDPLALRYFYLGAHYRSKQNFTWEAVEGAQTALHRLWDVVRLLPAETSATMPEALQVRFNEALGEDLNTPEALAVLWELIKSDVTDDHKSAGVAEMDAILGIGLADRLGMGEEEAPQAIKDLAIKRWDAKEGRDWAEADRLRDELLERGWVMEDGEDDYKLKKLP